MAVFIKKPKVAEQNRSDVPIVKKNGFSPRLFGNKQDRLFCFMVVR